MRAQEVDKLRAALARLPAEQQVLLEMQGIAEDALSDCEYIRLGSLAADKIKGMGNPDDPDLPNSFARRGALPALLRARTPR